MKRSNSSHFVLTLPLRCELWQHDKLDRMFQVGNYIKNNLISNRKKALDQMMRTKEWKQTQSDIVSIHKDSSLSDSDKKKRLAEPYARRSVLLKKYGFTMYDFEKAAQKYRKRYKKLIGAHVVQKIADTVWVKFDRFLFGDGKEIKFSKWADFHVLEAKSAASHFIFRDNFLRIGKMNVKIKRNPKDSYQEEALKNDVAFCKVVRRPYPEGWRYFVQLVLKGEPPVKKNKDGSVKHSLGTGRVGLDIGPQTLAFCGNTEVGLVELAAGAQNLQNQLRRINRAMDRSRRATNPQMFNAEGMVVPINNLPPECVNRSGKRRWKKSKHYQVLEQQRRYLYWKQASLRTQKHNELANKLLILGDQYYIEKMDFRALAKKAKESKKNAKGKNLSRKRFGKSVANKAPALFMNILEEKVIKAGGAFYRINTWLAKASQYNHLNRTYNKKKLSERWNIMPDGQRIQRDMYSAFLIQHTDESLAAFDQTLCEKDYPSFVVLHNIAIQNLRGTKLPSSAGI